ncbi:MAG: hypothetical protein M1819_006027 [Sarea resinae]|nr:MAG: hypothetical protein M1819_006027 [Sarea resinae]
MARPHAHESPPNHYAVLNLPRTRLGQPVSAQEVKFAYRRALLQHHPDKLPLSKERSTIEDKRDGGGGSTSAYSIDAITDAYKTLIDATARAEYDRLLSLQRHDSQLGRQGSAAGHAAEAFHSGLEIVDLDDLDFDDAKGLWYRGCRCGQEKGFVVTEEELDKEASHGEIFTGCQGCSLWLKVLFEAIPDEDDHDNDVG